MMFEWKKIEGKGFRLSLKEEGKEIARAYLYVLKNDLHAEPFGFLEDVFVIEEKRGKGIGKMVVKEVIEKAKALGCYKLIATSRFSRTHVHNFYTSLGFSKVGYEFRIDCL